MDRWRAAGALLALAACFATSIAAPTSSNNQTGLDLYDEHAEGCYYNFQHYGEGDRIMTNEPCLNCTCHNRMLMCYLRVCPFTKAIGQDCTVEKRADQCCPIVTCPDVPVDLLTSTSTTSPAEYGGTGVGKVDNYGCTINGRYFSEGSKVPQTPGKPCEHCYCIRNMTTCVMQECTLHVDGCTPIYHKDVCCPVRYFCDHPEEEMPLLDDMTTTVRPTPGFLLTTTTATEEPTTAPPARRDCIEDDQLYPDGALIKTAKPCEHCYCMKGDIVCVVQECGTPMENEGKNCTSLQPREGQCCPDTYICEGDELITELPTEIPLEETEIKTTITPPRRVSVEGSGYRNEPDDVPYTEAPIFSPETEGSGEEELIQKPVESIDILKPDIEITTSEQPSLEDKLGLTEKDEFIPKSTQSSASESDQTTAEPDGGLNTVPSEQLYEKVTEISEAQTTESIDTKITGPVSAYNKEDDTTLPIVLQETTTVKSSTSAETESYDKFTEPTQFVTQPTDESDMPQKESSVEPEIQDKDEGTESSILKDETTVTPVKSDSDVATEPPESPATKEPAVTESVTEIDHVTVASESKDEEISDSSSGIPTQDLVTEYAPSFDKENETFGEDTRRKPGPEDEDKMVQITTPSALSEGPLDTSTTLSGDHSDLSHPSESNTIPIDTDEEQVTDTLKLDEDSLQGITNTPETLKVTEQESQTTESIEDQTTAHSESYKPTTGEYPRVTELPVVAEDESHKDETTTNDQEEQYVTTESIFIKDDKATESIGIVTGKDTEPETGFSDTTDASIAIGYDSTSPEIIPEGSTEQTKLTTAQVQQEETDQLEYTTMSPSKEFVDQRHTSQAIDTTTESIMELATFAHEQEPVSEPINDIISSEKPDLTEKTTINPEDNEIAEEIAPGRIPGEGDCLLEGVTYKNESVVPSNNKCHTGCRCISSIIKCDPIICSAPPEYMDNCQPRYDTPESCCPTYICDHGKETIPPQPHSQMSGTESSVSSPSTECNENQCDFISDKPTEMSPQPPHETVECEDEECKVKEQVPVIPQQPEYPVECSDSKCSSLPEACTDGKCEASIPPTESEILPTKDISPLCESPESCVNTEVHCAGDTCKPQPETQSQEVPVTCANEEDCRQATLPELSKPSCVGDLCIKDTEDCHDGNCKVVPHPHEPSQEEACSDSSCKKQQNITPECGNGICDDKEIIDSSVQPECTGDQCSAVSPTKESPTSVPQMATSPEHVEISSEKDITDEISTSGPGIIPDIPDEEATESYQTTYKSVTIVSHEGTDKPKEPEMESFTLATTEKVETLSVTTEGSPSVDDQEKPIDDTEHDTSVSTDLPQIDDTRKKIPSLDSETITPELDSEKTTISVLDVTTNANIDKKQETISPESEIAKTTLFSSEKEPSTTQSSLLSDKTGEVESTSTESIIEKILDDSEKLETPEEPTITTDTERESMPDGNTESPALQVTTERPVVTEGLKDGDTEEVSNEIPKITGTESVVEMSTPKTQFFHEITTEEVEPVEKEKETYIPESTKTPEEEAAITTEVAPTRKVESEIMTSKPIDSLPTSELDTDKITEITMVTEQNTVTHVPHVEDEYTQTVSNVVESETMKPIHDITQTTMAVTQMDKDSGSITSEVELQTSIPDIISTQQPDLEEPAEKPGLTKIQETETQEPNQTSADEITDTPDKVVTSSIPFDEISQTEASTNKITQLFENTETPKTDIIESVSSTSEKPTATDKTPSDLLDTNISEDKEHESETPIEETTKQTEEFSSMSTETIVQENEPQLYTTVSDIDVSAENVTPLLTTINTILPPEITASDKNQQTESPLSPVTSDKTEFTTSDAVEYSTESDTLLPGKKDEHDVLTLPTAIDTSTESQLSSDSEYQRPLESSTIYDKPEYSSEESTQKQDVSTPELEAPVTEQKITQDAEVATVIPVSADAETVTYKEKVTDSVETTTSRQENKFETYVTDTAQLEDKQSTMRPDEPSQVDEGESDKQESSSTQTPEIKTEKVEPTILPETYTEIPEISKEDETVTPLDIATPTEKITNISEINPDVVSLTTEVTTDKIPLASETPYDDKFEISTAKETITEHTPFLPSGDNVAPYSEQYPVSTEVPVTELKDYEATEVTASLQGSTKLPEKNKPELEETSEGTTESELSDISRTRTPELYTTELQKADTEQQPDENKVSEGPSEDHHLTVTDTKDDDLLITKGPEMPGADEKVESSSESLTSQTDTKVQEFIEDSTKVTDAHEIEVPVTESILSENSEPSLYDKDKDTVPNMEPEIKQSETTPYLVELEEHTHKIDVDVTTSLPSDELSTVQDTLSTSVPGYEPSHVSDDELQQTPPTSEVHPDNERTELPAIDQKEQTTTAFISVTEKATETESLPDKFTSTETPLSSPSDLLKEKDKEHTTPQPTLDEGTISPIESESPDQSEKEVTPKPPAPETTAPEEEFIPFTTKVTENKAEEEHTTPTTLADKFTKPSDILPTSAPEVSKPEEQQQPTDEITPTEEDHFPPSGGYNQEPDYVEEDQAFGPGTCRYGGKVYVSAQQIPRDDPCDFCFCFRSDIICLQQSCPPPIHGCHEEPIQGFCCPRYECPVSMATTLNVTTTTTTTTTTLPPHFLPHAYKGAAQRRGCQIKGHTYKVGEVVRASSGPCLHCTCGGDGQMKCDPKACTPEPMLRQMIAAAVSAKRRR